MRQHDQYVVRIDGSGKVTLRNRKNLRIVGFKKPNEPFPDTTVPRGGGGNTPVKVGRELSPVRVQTPVRRTVTPARATPSPVFHTPPEEVQVRAPSLAVSPVGMGRVTPSLPTPKRVVTVPARRLSTPKLVVTVPAKRLEMPAASAVKMVPSAPSPEPVYHQLRGHNNPGLKEQPVVSDGPKGMRSGKSY